MISSYNSDKPYGSFMKQSAEQNKSVRYFGVQIVAFGVLINGVLLVINTLVQQFIRHNFRSSVYSVEVYLLVGLTLIYLSNLLWRRKYTAWIFTLLVYAFYLVYRLYHLSAFMQHHNGILLSLLVYFLPLVIVLALMFNRKAFNVRSDVRSFGVSLRISLVVIVITLCYGIAGFQLMDHSDFHMEISISQSIHRTVDQFGLTTNTQLVPYTKRARVFLDSLNVISLAAVGYVLLSLFQPIRARFEDQTENRNKTTKLLNSSHNNSEDFFKVWPHDKYYYFNAESTAGVAFTVHRGIAIVVGDPFGAVSEFKALIINFSEYCRINDWLPSFVHTEGHFNGLYEDLGFMCQKIGEEAIVDSGHFTKEVANNKYFRNINNKFKKKNYTWEVLKPPHNDALIDRLREISNDWLKQPGRSERAFMMGYFTNAYIQQCNVLVIRDDALTIQAFINQIISFDDDEANFDMLRHSTNALGNSNDYLMMNFIEYAHKTGFKRVNLGLCPLVGLDKKEENRTLIDNALSFLYSNGDRFYSFSGLYKFKQKYEPNWSDRFIIYKNGVSGLSRTLNALNIAMKPPKFVKRK